MAVDAKSVEDLADVLKEMGYQLGPGHKRGEVDDAFLAAYKPALNDLIHIGLKTDQNIPYSPQVRGQLLSVINAQKKETMEMDLLGEYAHKTLRTETMQNQIAGKLTEKKFSESLRQPEHVVGVLKFFEKADQYISTIDNVERELAARAAAPKVTPVSNPGTGSNIPGFGGSAVANPAADPVVDPAADEALRSKLQKFQEAAGEKWFGTKNGIYNKAYRNFLNKPENKNSEAAVFIKGLGMSAEDIEKATRRAWKVTHPDAQPVREASAPAVPVTTAPPVTTPTPITPGQTGTETGAGTSSSGGDTGNTKKDMGLTEATSLAEGGLRSLGKAINDQIAERAEKAGQLTTWLFEFKGIPVISDAQSKDGKFDRDSQRSLQAVLKCLQGDLGLTDDEIYNYTPETTGAKILAGYPKLERKLSEKQQKEVNEQKITDMVDALNKLHKDGKLVNEKIYNDSPIKANSAGAYILNFIFDLVGKVFPRARGLMDSMLMKLTGGFGYNELMPGGESKETDAHRSAVSESRKAVAGMTPEQRIEKQYLDVLGDAKKDGKEGALKSTLSTAIEKMVGLTENKQDQDAFKKAMEKAMAAAETKADPNEAAKSFATTFKNEWKGAIKPVEVTSIHPPASAAPPAPETSSAPTPKVDPPREQLKQDPPSSEQDSVVKKPEIDASVSSLPEGAALVAAYTSLGKDEKNRDKLLFFKRDNELHVMGRNNDGSLVAAKMGIEDIEIYRAAKASGSKSEVQVSGRPALGLLTSPRYQHYSLQQINGLMDKAGDYRLMDPKEAALRATKQTAADAQSRVSAPPTSTVDPDMALGSAVERNRHLSNQNQLRLAATGDMPAFIARDFTDRGRVRFVALTDRNGLLADKAYYEQQNGGRALADITRVFGGDGNPHFSTVDITDEYARYMRGYEQFFKDHKKEMMGMSERQQFAKYGEYLKDPVLGKGLDLEKEYPAMSAIIRNPEHKSTHYPYFVRDNKPDISKFAYFVHGQTNNGNSAKFDRDYGFSKDRGYGGHREVSSPVQGGFNAVFDAVASPFVALKNGIKNSFNSSAPDDRPRPAYTMNGDAAYNYKLPDYERDAKEQFPAAKEAAEALRQEQREQQQLKRERSEPKEEKPSTQTQFQQNREDINPPLNDDGDLVAANTPGLTGAAPRF